MITLVVRGVGIVPRKLQLLGVSIAALVLGGTVVVGAADPTVTDPVTICIAKSTFRVSETDTCTSKETTVQVASSTDVAQLAARLDVVEDQIAAGLPTGPPKITIKS